jgi:hypothetical protein
MKNEAEMAKGEKLKCEPQCRVDAIAQMIDDFAKAGDVERRAGAGRSMACTQ